VADRPGKSIGADAGDLALLRRGAAGLRHGIADQRRQIGRARVRDSAAGAAAGAAAGRAGGATARAAAAGAVGRTRAARDVGGGRSAGGDEQNEAHALYYDEAVDGLAPTDGRIATVLT